jgi:heme/copper-type cytochrome/quinol oxidase subunit 2
MNFFEHQEAARKKTSLLVFYYVLAVAAIVAAVYLAVVAASSSPRRTGRAGWTSPSSGNPELFILVAVATMALVGGGSVYRIASLSGGGQTVAELLDGRPIDLEHDRPG